MNAVEADNSPVACPREVQLGADLAGLVNAAPSEIAGALPMIEEAMSMDMPNLRALAVVLAGRAGGEGLPILEKALKSEAFDLRQLAILGLDTHTHHPDAIDALADAALDQDPTTAKMALMMLGRSGKAALGALRRLTQADNSTVAASALRAMGQAVKGTGLPTTELAAARNQKDPHLAIAAAEASVQASDDPGAGLIELIIALENADPEIRKAASEACSRLMGLAKPAAAHLQRLVTTDDEPIVRMAAARALALIGGFVANTVPTLTAALRDPDPEVRRAVIVALAALDDLAIPAVPALKALASTVANDEDQVVINAALERIEGDQA